MAMDWWYIDVLKLMLIVEKPSFQLDISGVFACEKYSKKCTTKVGVKVHIKKHSTGNIDDDKILKTHSEMWTLPK